MSQIPFYTLCLFFEKIHEAKDAKKRVMIFNVLMKKLKEICPTETNYYPLIRLLIPQCDKERVSYGLKETKISQIYLSLLQIPISSVDGKLLTDWKRNQLSGDFSCAVYEVLKNRIDVDKSKLTISDINDRLNNLNEDTLKYLLFNISPMEQKWLMRIILKDLKINLTINFVFGNINKDLVKYWNICSSLKKVCNYLSRYLSGEEISQLIQLNLFDIVKPMCCGRFPLDKIKTILQNKKFVIEQKYDGERVQVHLCKNGKSSGSTISTKLYSRNSNDVTRLYKKYIEKYLINNLNIDNCILDGEIIVWDSKLGKFEEFGNIKSFINDKDEDNDEFGSHLHSSSPSSMYSRDGKNLCYVVFDILMVNGESILHIPYQDRFKFLEKNMKEVPHVFQLPRRKTNCTIDDIENELEYAIKNKEEGIILKMSNSDYVPNDRGVKWIKLKADHVDMLDNFDLVIVGGYYGSSEHNIARGGKISTFLLAIYSKTDKIYIPICKVGTGYTASELENLRRKIDLYFQDSRPKNVKEVVEVPDVYIDPIHSQIVELKAAQLIQDKGTYGVGITFRFPRVNRIRYDLNVEDCFTIEELNSMSLNVISTKEKVVKEVKKPPKKVIDVPMHFKGTTNNVKQELNLFEGKIFCVMTGDDDYTKQQIEDMILKLGCKKIIQTPPYPNIGENKVDYIIVGKSTVKVKNLLMSKEYKLYKLQWIINCEKNGKIENCEEYVF